MDGDCEEDEDMVVPEVRRKVMRTSLLWIQTTLLKLISKVQLLVHTLDN
jgi:hypothetical protein